MFGGAVWETFTVWANKPGLGKRKIEMLFLFICYLKKHLPGEQIIVYIQYFKQNNINSISYGIYVYL